jgi:hypothetical protein
VPEIVVSRPDEGWVNPLSPYEIIVDDRVAANLGRSEDVAISVDEGAHTIRAKLDWCGSREVVLNLGAGDRVYLHCQVGVGRSVFPPKMWVYVTLWRNRYLDLQVLRVESGNSPVG